MFDHANITKVRSELALRRHVFFKLREVRTFGVIHALWTMLSAPFDHMCVPFSLKIFAIFLADFCSPDTDIDELSRSLFQCQLINISKFNLELRRHGHALSIPPDPKTSRTFLYVESIFVMAKE